VKSKFDWRAAYFNVVCLAGVIVFLIAAIGAGHGALRLVFPSLSMDEHDWRQAESFEAYKRWGGKDIRAPRPVVEPAGNAIEAESNATEEELRTEWAEYRELLIEGEKRRGLFDLMQSLMTLIIAVPVYWWHRRGARAVRSEDVEKIELDGNLE
jgi:hypothetical protein